jgi:hypothetical protein
VTLRKLYQIEATTTALAELPGWDEWLKAKGLSPQGTPVAASTRALSVTGVDPDAKPLTA